MLDQDSNLLCNIACKLTVSITAHSELNIVRYLHLHHRGLLVHDLLDSHDDLVDEFLVDLLAVLEPLDHVVNELLRHLVLDLYAVVVRFDSDSIEVEAFGGRGLVAHFYGSVEVELSHDLLAFGKLELRVLVVGVQLRAFLEIFEGILGLENGGVGDGTAEISLDRAWRVSKGWSRRQTGRGWVV